MQAIILAAGKSTRTYPLTLTRPKPILKVGGKPILEHDIESILSLNEKSNDYKSNDYKIEEIIVVIGYKKTMIKEFLKDRYKEDKYKNVRIRLVEQKEQNGTGDALLTVEKNISGRFILMMGDNIYSKSDIAECLKWHSSILTAKVDNPEQYGVIKEKKEKNGFLEEIVEKPKIFISNKINAALYVLDDGIFSSIRKISKSQRGELELTDALNLYSKNRSIKLVEGKLWLPVGNPAELLEADKKMRDSKNIIGDNTKIKGKVVNSSIGNNCEVEGDVRDSIIMDNTKIKGGSEVSGCIIGEKVEFSGRAYGCFIGDNAVAEDVAAKGIRVWPGKKIKGAVEKDAK